MSEPLGNGESNKEPLTREVAVNRILGSGLFPPRSLIPAPERMIVVTEDDLTLLESRVEQAETSNDFTTLPFGISFESPVDVAREVRVIESLRKGEKDDSGNIRKPLVEVVAKTNDADVDKQLAEAGAGWVGNNVWWNREGMLLNSLVTGVKTIPDMLDLVHGDVKKVQAMVNVFDNYWNQHSGEGTFIEQLGNLPKVDAVMFSARSGVHWGFMLKGFAKGLKEQGVDVDEPELLASWYKVRNIVRNRLPAVKNILDTYSSIEEIQNLSIEETEAMLKEKHWEKKSEDDYESQPDRYKIADWKAEAEAFKSNYAPFLFEAVDYTKAQLESIMIAKNKNHLQLAFFDEIHETHATLDGSIMLAECAAKKLTEEKGEPVTVDCIRMEDVSLYAPYGSYPTWDEVPLHDVALKITRPNPDQPLFHVAHRIMMRGAEEVGRYESQKTLQTGGSGEAFINRYKKSE